ncbi:divergent polysaccharide deacetylase family protein [Paenibacillus sp. YPG26]|uniref:divergent polysaccharide deacetylase family protein n=1 Tax=Paenibacillus sp. YPG26 TaxID=2878915 RepID=UPI00203B426C|nr:divergent polysaccharide deacetylase family protein [Paenibacillus sp. YPG26]USB32202.1 divergent polysaccharide deacetylase family protein [Paenibacillus sp. YPG26]
MNRLKTKGVSKGISRRVAMVLTLGGYLLGNPASAYALTDTGYTIPEESVVMSDPVGEAQNPKVQPKKKLAVIIDDLGNKMEGTDEILSMPVKLTVAVMPFLQTTQQDAKRAHERGYDVLVHLPMEPKQGKPEWLGPGAVLAKLPNEEVRKRVEAAIDNVPYAVGINNHMGSKVTADERIMSIVLDICKERGLFFVDSKTNHQSVVGKLCEQKGLPQVYNHIFLDDVATDDHISRQIGKVSKWLKNHESCVTIGHVGSGGKRTASVLRHSIHMLKQEAEFVGVSDLARERSKPDFIVP